jgi:hypothetical protein
MLGRTFEPSEDVGRNAHPVTVVSYETWKDRYHGDPAIIGKTQRLNGVQHDIIGVMPEGFFGAFVGYSFQFWVLASMEENFEGGGYKLENRGARWIEGFAFLKPGVTIEQAQAEISAVGKRLEAAYPDTNRGRGFVALGARASDLLRIVMSHGLSLTLAGVVGGRRDRSVVDAIDE